MRRPGLRTDLRWYAGRGQRWLARMLLPLVDWSYDVALWWRRRRARRENLRLVITRLRSGE